MRPVAVLCAAALLALCTSGCFGGKPDKRPAVPAGAKEYRGDGFSFAYPAGWRQVAARDERGLPVVKLNGPELPSGAYDGQVHLSRWDAYPRGLDLQLAQFRGLALLNRYRITVSRPVRVDGAAQAHRLEATYAEPLAGGGQAAFRLLGMYVLTERKVLIEFMLRSPADGAADARLEEIFDSFRLEGR